MDFKSFMKKIDGKESAPEVRYPWDYTPVRGVSVRPCRRVLQGNSDDLHPAFVWSSTPQGHRHWEMRCFGREILTVEDREFIQGLIKYAEGLDQ